MPYTVGIIHNTNNLLSLALTCMESRVHCRREERRFVVLLRHQRSKRLRKQSVKDIG